VAVRPVLRFPHSALKRKAPSLPPREHARIERVAADLLDTMRAHKGCVGLAAPQIDEAVRLVVVDVTEHPRAETSNGLLLLADPLVVVAEGGEVAREGCLSIPTLTANVRRATRITVEGKRPSGDPHRFESEGFEARCLQHEIDHLDGILFLDRVDSLTADVFRRKRYQ
jgi:peptide deformylase